jgi:hypothetical protein
MGKGAAISEGSFGENISHLAAIRIRLTGEGQLNMRVFSLDDERVKALVPFQMALTTRIIPTRLVNFVETRAAFQLTTTKMNERFRINRIIIFIKEIYSSHPGS